MSSCSINSEPAAQRIDVSSVSHRSTRPLARAGALIGTIGVALVPKCPACWSIYAGLAGWLGFSVALERSRLLPLTVACLGLTLSMLVGSARRSGRHAPLVGAALCAAGVYVGKFVLESEWLTCASLLGLALAALVGRRSERRSKLAQHA